MIRTAPVLFCTLVMGSSCIDYGLDHEETVDLRVTPTHRSFERRTAECPQEKTITFTNKGSHALEVSSVSLIDPDGQFSVPVVNWLLEPEASFDVDVTYLAADVGFAEGSLIFQTDAGEKVVTLAGEAFGRDTETETFSAHEQPPVDLLFVVDQSNSMSDDNKRLASGFIQIIDGLRAANSDWHLGVATADHGCFRYGVLDKDTVDLETLFAVSVQAGDGGNFTEELLNLAHAAVKESDASGCNAGFLRTDAILHVTMVSDEDEQSSEWKKVIDRINVERVGATLPSVFSAISGPPSDEPGACTSAVPGDRYQRIAKFTGGQVHSICETDWTAHFEGLVNVSLGLTMGYELKYDAIELDSFVVTVAGEETTDFAYEASRNAIVFDDEIEAGTEITVTYMRELECP